MRNLELTILMPCLNEAETIERCVRMAQDYLEASGVAGEVLIADNGSTDGSQAIATAAGARVVPVPARGYGAALLGGIASAEGRFVIMGDADASYDLSRLDLFVARLRAGADLVMGNRFQGGIMPGAMPPLHRYLGNPVLSWLGRLFFRIPIGDFHCGLRGFNRDRIRTLGLQTTGMEFASEMVVRSALAGFRIEEVPTILSPDGRSRPPHLRTWRDGWRHLIFLLMFSPRWLFLYPGLAMLAAAIVTVLLLLPGDRAIAGVGIGTHTFIVACFLALVGCSTIGLALIARRFATSHGLIPRSTRYSPIIDAFTLERILVGAGILMVLGIIGVGWSFLTWASTGFGPLNYPVLLRVLVLSLTVIAISVQAAFAAFLSGITEVR